MRARTAIPILLLSAAVMVAGLATAQQRPQIPTPRLPLQTPRLPAGTQGLDEALQERAAQERAKQTKQGPQAGGDDGPDTPGGALGGPPNVDRFETGIDYRPMPPGAPVTFNLEDADLPDLVRLISQITGKRFILPGKVRSIKASVYAPTKVTAAEAYNAFLSILELNGMTVVPSGRYLKIVETSGIENQPIPTYTGGTATPGDDRYVTRMHRVENVSAEDVAQLLSRFKTREGNVTAYAPTNTVIITDLGSNIRRMLRVVEAIDVPRTGEQIWIEPIHYANATELAARLQEIFPVGQTSAPGGGGGASRPTPPGPGRTARAARNQGGGNRGAATVGSRSGESRVTKILADERTNSLIILATERAYLRILELIRELDVPLEGEGRIHVHYVQHGDAEEIASTLSSLIGGTGGGGGRPAGRPPAGQQGAGGGGNAVASGALFEGEIRVTAHEPSNALVITSSLHDYASLRRVIERLDAPRRQVFIEAVIMELSVDRSRSLGISFHGGIADFPEDGSLTLLGSSAATSLAFPADQNSLTGLALGVRGPAIPESQQLIGLSVPAFGVVLNALATSGDANVLSTPHIIAMDNVEAEISVGENVPLQTNLGFGGGLGGLGGLGRLLGGAQAAQGAQGAAGLAGLAGLAGGLSGFAGSVPRQDVGTTLRITPHINDANEVRMEIQEEISSASPSTEGTLGVRSVSKRTAKTELVVRDGQTVVIGGLMRDEVQNTETKVPILGDIPVLGLLFRDQRRETRKRNLLLFLTPYVIRDSSDLRAIFERKMRERQEFIDRYFVFGDHDYEPPIDYSRTRGLVREIVNELDAIAFERELAEQLRSQPPPEHVPRPPVGRVEVEPQPGEGDVIIVPEGEAETVDDSGSPPIQVDQPDLPGSVPLPENEPPPEAEK